MKLHSYVHHHHNYYRGHQLIKIKKRKKETLIIDCKAMMHFQVCMTMIELSSPN